MDCLLRLFRVVHFQVFLEERGDLGVHMALALSRLSEMGSKMWVERGMGLESQGGKQERDSWAKTRSRQMEDSM